MKLAHHIELYERSYGWVVALMGNDIHNDQPSRWTWDSKEKFFVLMEEAPVETYEEALELANELAEIHDVHVFDIIANMKKREGAKHG